MSKKRKSRKNAEARPTNKRVKSERNRLLWQLVTEYPDIFVIVMSHDFLFSKCSSIFLFRGKKREAAAAKERHC